MTAQKKIAIFLPSLRGGGAERAILTLANSLADRGESIDLVLGKAEGEYLTEVSPKVRVVDLNSPRLLLSFFPLVRYMKSVHPTALLSVLNYANVIAVIARAVSKVKVRLVLSERNNITLPKGSTRSIKETILLMLMRFTYPRADKIVAVSEGVASDLAHSIKLSEKKIVVVYNPVVTQHLLDSSNAHFSHPWFESGEPPVLLGVGRLTSQKDFATLIRAFAIARSAQPCRLVILGEGELRQELENLIHDLSLGEAASLPGFAKNPFAWMKKSSLFILSSRWEGLPNALIQAMACGTAVISTDCKSGPHEILEGGKWGSLVPIEDPEALSEKIIEHLAKTKHFDNPRIRASHFSEENAASGYLSALMNN